MSNKVFFNIFSRNVQNISDLNSAELYLNKEKPTKIVLFDNDFLGNVSWFNFSRKPKNTIPPERRQVLEAWTLDYDFYVDSEDLDAIELDNNPDATDAEKEELICNYHFREKADILNIYNTWYQNYLEAHNGVEMNFLSAMQYLKDNPDEKPAIKEFIKKAFGICDGIVTDNEQNGIGSCQLLASREELENDLELNDVVENLIKQNDDGTVTVTFAGIITESDKPIQFTIENKKIKESYSNFDITTDFMGGSTDPDDAALEIARSALLEYLVENYHFDKTADKINEINETFDNKKRKLESEILKITDKFYEYLTENREELRSAGKATKLLDYIDEIPNMGTHVVKNANSYFMGNIKNNMDNYIDELKELNVNTGTCELEKLITEYKNLMNERDIFIQKTENISALENFIGYHDEFGMSFDSTLTLLTGMGDRVLSDLTQFKLDEFLKNINYDISNRTVVACLFDNEDYGGILAEHAYMVKEITEDENGKKFVILKNPHNTEYDKNKNFDHIVDGNPGNTFTISYWDFINMFNVTTILKSEEKGLYSEDLKNQKPYYKLPDDFIF